MYERREFPIIDCLFTQSFEGTNDLEGEVLVIEIRVSMESKARVEKPLGEDCIDKVTKTAWDEWKGEVDNVPELEYANQRLEFVESIKKHLNTEGIGLKDRVISGVEFDDWVQEVGDYIDEVGELGQPIPDDFVDPLTLIP